MTFTLTNAFVYEAVHDTHPPGGTVATALLSTVSVDRASLKPKSLGRVLLDLEIDVYPNDQVEVFKIEFMKTLVQQTTRRAKTHAFVSSVGIVALFFAACYSFSKSSLIGFFLFTTCAIWFIAANVRFDMKLYDLGQVRWETCSLDFFRCGRFVPKEAHTLVRKIRKQLPGAQFEVDYIETDPFLWVKLRGQQYCIAHWDEPFTDR